MWEWFSLYQWICKTWHTEVEDFRREFRFLCKDIAKIGWAESEQGQMKGNDVFASSKLWLTIYYDLLNLQ